MTSVAFLGLGAMGSRTAANLLAAGHGLRVYNRDAAKTAPFAQSFVVCAFMGGMAQGATAYERYAVEWRN